MEELEYSICEECGECIPKDEELCIACDYQRNVIDADYMDTE